MPGGNKKGGGLKSSSAFKMKGFSGFGSPIEQKGGGFPKDFNIKGSDWPKKTPGYESTKMAKASKAAKYTAPNIDWTLNDNLNKAVKGEGPGSPKTLRNNKAREKFIKENTVKSKTPKKLWRPFGPGTRPFAKNVTKVLKPITKAITKSVPVVAAAETGWSVGRFIKDATRKHGSIEKAWDKNKWWGSKEGNLLKADDPKKGTKGTIKARNLINEAIKKQNKKK
jgi:hypothetical protein